MAIIKCAECDKSVSSHAIACPNCGYPFNRKGENVPPIIPDSKPLGHQELPRIQLKKPQIKPQPKKSKVLLAVLMSLIIGGILSVLIIIGNSYSNVGSETGEMHNPSGQSGGDNKFFAAGFVAGTASGLNAYNEGQRHANSDDLDAEARRRTSAMNIVQSEDRKDWIEGFKAGYDAGWSTAKAP